MFIEPAIPSTDDPDKSRIEPEGPKLEAPESSRIPPDEPPKIPALEVDKIIILLVWLELLPDIRTTEPPEPTLAEPPVRVILPPILIGKFPLA